MLEPSDKPAALQQIACAIDAGRPLPLSARWLSRAIREYLRTGKRLDRCLNLNVRRGGRWETLQSLSRQRERNAFIAAWMTEMPAKTRTQQAELLARILKQEIYAYPLSPKLVQDFHVAFPGAPKSSKQILRIVNGQTMSTSRNPFI